MNASFQTKPNIDRVSETWATLVQMYGARLTRDFGVSAPDAWARTINSLNDYELQRGLRRLLANGTDTPPTLPKFSKLCKTIGEEDGPSRPHPNPQTALPLNIDPFDAHGQKCLLQYLMAHGGASAASVQAMVAKKNLLVQQFRDISAEDTVTGVEIRDALFGAFRQLWKPIPPEELAMHREEFKRTGFASDSLPRHPAA